MRPRSASQDSRPFSLPDCAGGVSNTERWLPRPTGPRKPSVMPREVATVVLSGWNNSPESFEIAEHRTLRRARRRASRIERSALMGSGPKIEVPMEKTMRIPTILLCVLLAGCSESTKEGPPLNPDQIAFLQEWTKDNATDAQIDALRRAPPRPVSAWQATVRNVREHGDYTIIDTAFRSPQPQPARF